jgi:RHS repeat-associated protein
VDIHGNATVSCTTINPADQSQTQTVDYPDSTIDAKSVTEGGLLVENTTKSGLTTTFAYDALGRRTGVTDPRTGTATTHYDTQGQVDWVEDSAGHRTEFAYDPVTGRKTGQTDALGKVTRFAYNDRGQVTHTWGDGPYPVRYQYDAYGRMSAMTTYRADEGFAADSFPASATGDTTTWHYDPATGQLTAKEYADGSQVTYTYTTAGKLETRTWARQDSGQPLTTTYGYDPATGELTTIDYSDATADIAFSYDRLGRQSRITDAVGTHTFAYNSALQLDSETVTGLYDATLTRTYDTTVPGRPAGFNLGAGYSVTYGYDAATGRFRSVAWNAAGKSDTATYGYLANSDLLEQVTTATGRKTTYGFEPDRNLKTSVRNDVNGATVSQYDYVYDAVGRRTSVADTGSAFAQAAFDAYNYNDRSELIASDRYLGTDIFDTSSPVTDRQRGYLYDPIGNRTQAEEAGVQTAYSANALNQYTDISGPTTYTPAYDADGNLQNAPDGMHYTYNAENRLIAAQPQSPADGDTRTEYVYDYMGRRVQKVVYSYSSGAWVQDKEILFVYDGWNLIKETTTADGGSSVDKYYVWGLDLSQSLQGAGGVGGLLAVIDGSLTCQYLYDANGNVGQLVDASDGSIAARYEYDPYGNLTDLGGAYANANAYRFSTKYFDSETKLYYYGYRYYSPLLGRWINRDPIGEEGGFNLYMFVQNDSIIATDSLGLRKIYLQFDDPPIGGTKIVLDALAATNAKATFFIVGQHMKEMGSGIVKRIDAAGHTIGNHSYSHWYKQSQLKGKTPADWVADFKKGEDIIYKATGKRPKLARIPGNKPEWKKDVAKALQNEGWKVLGWDWEIGGHGKGNGNPREPAVNAKTIKDNGYTNILMHPQYHRYKGAKEDLICFINALKQMGHTIDALPYEQKN